MRYREKIYRDYEKTSRWTAFRVKIDTTDLLIRARFDLSGKTGSIVRRLRNDLLDHISRNESFLTSLTPLPCEEGCPEIAALMHRAAEKAGVGPMAAVAGAIAEITGRELLSDTTEIIVENGGDIWLSVIEPVTIKIFSGNGHFADSLSLRIMPDRTPCGICTSSGRMGHSLSFGKADTATVISPDAALADAVATETCNRVTGEESLTPALEYAMGVEEISGVVIVYRDKLAAQGQIEFT
ncbi:MAG: hypothetical protein CVV44_13045 [Spirochaetae bacterium HGW-Spirochaetae-1]|jgi:hypothetical protein|nr:MAG: hypothetical protein CVV44_13045 [Spirochaetae bacterium HGW-Spirochaetae-1]